MTTYVTSIGRNVAGVPMSDAVWHHFRSELWGMALDVGPIFFEGTGIGYYEDEREESFTVIHKGQILPDDLARLAERFGQECIASTTGTTTLITPSGWI